VCVACFSDTDAPSLTQPQVLGVEGATDVEKLLSFFLADADNHELIHPNDAIKAIKAFVEEHEVF